MFPDSKQQFKFCTEENKNSKSKKLLPLSESSNFLFLLPLSASRADKVAGRGNWTPVEGGGLLLKQLHNTHYISVYTFIWNGNKIR